MTRQEAVLNFWFSECDEKQWFEKDDAFDQMMRDRFLSDVENALAGDYDDWVETAEGRLALILLLDQFTRNIFRDTPQAFAGDEKALALCLEGIERGYLDILKERRVWFFLLPMEHSEDIEIQKTSLPLFKKYPPEDVYQYAVAHHDIIERFGRFPHRNKILGRESTPEEIEFLKGPNSSF